VEVQSTIFLDSKEAIILENNLHYPLGYGMGVQSIHKQSIKNKQKKVWKLYANKVYQTNPGKATKQILHAEPLL